MKRDLPYSFFRAYMRFVHDYLFYRNVYTLGTDNLPKEGEPTLVVANHQSALNDPLALHFAFKNITPTILARGDIFNQPLLARFFRWIGLLPAYRMRVDGEESLLRNYNTFEEAGLRLMSGGVVAIFPEAVNQDKRWLGEWSLGYLRMAFDAAGREGFQRDIKVVPTALHYSNYFSAQKDMLVSFGEPVSLMPFYELYKTKPRTACREANRIIRPNVEQIMLNINDLDNYEAIDYIRETYGVRYARKRGVNPRSLPERLSTDKELCKVLEAQSDKLSDVYTEALQLKSFMEQEKLRDWVFDYHWRWWRMVVGVFALLLLLPLYLVALIPHIIIFYAPQPLVKKFDAIGGNFTAYKMFAGGIRYAVSALVSIPLCYLAVFIADCCLFDVWFALIHLLLLPLLGRFAWYYRLYFIKLKGVCRYWLRRDNNRLYREWTERRKRLYERLDSIVNYL